VNGPELTGLIERKRSDNIKTDGMIDQLAILNTAVDHDLAAGLMTKGEAAQQRATIMQFSNSLTDSKVGELMLRDSVRQKTTTDLDTLTALSKQVDLKSQIVQLDVNIHIGEQQIRTDETQITTITQAIEIAKKSPYFIATQGNRLHLAFVPYDNESSVTLGAPVYDCYLNMIACRKVGKITSIFTDEQHAAHPIFNTPLRGFFVQLDLTNIKSAKSKTLFIGGKPLWF
jgi:hypothetical protein